MARIIDPVLLTLVEFDVVTNATHRDQGKWTRHNVETGIPITDHNRREPTELTLEGVITDTPNQPEDYRPQRARAAYERLLELKDRSALVIVATEMRVHASMGISSVELVEGPNETGGAFLVVELAQVRIVNAVNVPIPPELLKPPVKSSQSSGGDMGRQSGQVVVTGSGLAPGEVYEADVKQIYEDGEKVTVQDYRFELGDDGAYTETYTRQDGTFVEVVNQ